jgi:hypothetical protein
MAVSGLTLVSGVGIFVDTRDLVLCLLDRGLDIGFDGGCQVSLLDAGVDIVISLPSGTLSTEVATQGHMPVRTHYFYCVASACC